MKELIECKIGVLFHFATMKIGSKINSQIWKKF